MNHKCIFFCAIQFITLLYWSNNTVAASLQAAQERLLKHSVPIQIIDDLQSGSLRLLQETIAKSNANFDTLRTNHLSNGKAIVNDVKLSKSQYITFSNGEASFFVEIEFIPVINNKVSNSQSYMCLYWVKIDQKWTLKWIYCSDPILPLINNQSQLGESHADKLLTTLEMTDPRFGVVASDISIKGLAMDGIENVRKNVAAEIRGRRPCRTSVQNSNASYMCSSILTVS